MLNSRKKNSLLLPIRQANTQYKLFSLIFILKVCVDNYEKEEIYVWLTFKYNLDSNNSDCIFNNITFPIE
jgi:hypothetical protein